MGFQLKGSALPKDPRGTQAHQWSCCCELQSWAHDWLGNFPSPSLHPDDITVTITIMKHHRFLKQLLGASCQIRRSQAFTATSTPWGSCRIAGSNSPGQRQGLAIPVSPK